MESRTVIIEPPPTPIIMGGREHVGAAGMVTVFANCPRPRPLATFAAYDRRAADISRSRGAARPFDAARRRPVLKHRRRRFRASGGPARAVETLSVHRRLRDAGFVLATAGEDRGR